jgi:hypothetical protein
MNRIPLQTDVIPVGTGLVQSVECKGRKLGEGLRSEEPLQSPVVAQIVTFSERIRKVCCIHVFALGRKKICTAGSELNHRNRCIYDWDEDEK